jgi:uncharacterized membrane protein
VAQVFPGSRVCPELTQEINRAFILGTRRTLTQDVEFPMNQLVEIAVRSLSPGINDPFTAMACLDRLGAALCHLAQKPFPSPYRYDAAGKLRVIAEPFHFTQMLDLVFLPIQEYGRTSTLVTLRLLETLAVIAPHVGADADRAALARHAAVIATGSQDGLAAEVSRQRVAEQYQRVVSALERAVAAPAPGV